MMTFNPSDKLSTALDTEVAKAVTKFVMQCQGAPELHRHPSDPFHTAVFDRQGENCTFIGAVWAEVHAPPPAHLPTNVALSVYHAGRRA